MKKKVITLSCIAAVAIATFVGTKVLQSNACENGLLTQNVEALSKSESGGLDCYKHSIYKHGSQILYCDQCRLLKNSTGSGKGKC